MDRKQADAAAGGGADGDAPPVRNAADAWVVLKEESGRIWGIGAPIAFNIICIYSVTFATTAFVGHLGNLQLSGASIALNVVNNFAFGFLYGMGSALETLCGQAFGAGQVSMLGVYMQRSWIILFISALVMVPVYAFAEPLLVLIGQDPTVAGIAGKFSILIIPNLFSMALNFPAGKFLQAQSKVVVITWISFIVLLFHILLLYVFLFVFNWGLTGAAVAVNISSWLGSIGQVIYIVGWCTDGWRGLSMAAFFELWEFFRLSLESAVMLCLEMWYISMLTVLTGHLKDAEIAVAALSICNNVNGWECMIFIGLNAAISVRVSNELGANRPRATMYSVMVVLVEALAIGLLFMVIILVTRDDFSIIFTTNKELQTAVSKIAGLLAVTMVLNSIQPVISGVAIGGGWQGLVAYINLFCYYVFGLPLGYFFGYVFDWGVLGIWAGMLCGIGLQTLILLFVVWRTDWKAEASQASMRVRRWGGQEVAKPLLE